MYLFGYRVISTEFCSDLVQARTHKKKRINKKWLKRYGMKRIPWKTLIITNRHEIYGHPSVISKLITDCIFEEVGLTP